MVVEQVKEKAKSAIKEGAKKLIKRFGWGYLLEWTPFIGFLWPGNVILVLRELKGNLMGPEGILMLPIAFFAYLITLTIGIIEIWFDLGIFTTLITWMIAGFFAAWIYIRGGGATGGGEGKKDDEVMGSENPKDWKQNEKGVYELKEGKGGTPNAGGSPKSPSAPTKK